ncbi:unnamed protein product [Nippostrongylus brasiliensis]|uniref:Secreted protein n=1 Tax=Nippostrongylus brasiliensis TaxID=27835 RepID=A0A0N4Y028_NIPBR|nr:unnamed protein product [Nippostrongylus brasiliensis]
MHRMTDYIMDLRNMTIGLVVISVIGVCGFLLLRIVQGRSSRRRRQRSLMRYVKPWDRMKTSLSHHSQIEDKKPMETSAITTESKPNGNLSYKYYNNDDQFAPAASVERRTTPPHETLPYSKRSADIQLLVENLPYADT